MADAAKNRYINNSPYDFGQYRGTDSQTVCEHGQHRKIHVLFEQNLQGARTDTMTDFPTLEKIIMALTMTSHARVNSSVKRKRCMLNHCLFKTGANCYSRSQPRRDCTRCGLPSPCILNRRRRAYSPAGGDRDAKRQHVAVV